MINIIMIRGIDAKRKDAGKLENLTALGHFSALEHRSKDDHAASMLAGAVKNDYA